MNLQVGEKIGPYHILEVIGSGGAGHVYKAEHSVTKRIEALKIVPGSLDSSMYRRFLREIEVHARLAHPNIASVYHAFNEDGQTLMAMEYVDGRPLDRLIRERPIPLPEAIDYVQQVLTALEHAHKQGIVHRDVSPSNILITTDGIAKLADFGLAKAPDDIRLTQMGTAVGSLGYMSPEQVRGLPDVDGRSDLYSVGAILYQLITGRPVFESENAYELMQSQVDQPPTPPSEHVRGLPPALDRAVLKALEKSPDKRFQSADEFKGELSRISLTLLGAVLPSPAVKPRRTFSRKARLWIGIASVAAATGLVVYIDKHYPYEPPLRSEPSATAQPLPVSPPVAAPSTETETSQANAAEQKPSPTVFAVQTSGVSRQASKKTLVVPPVTQRRPVEIPTLPDPPKIATASPELIAAGPSNPAAKIKPAARADEEEKKKAHPLKRFFGRIIGIRDDSRNEKKP